MPFSKYPPAADHSGRNLPTLRFGSFSPCIPGLSRNVVTALAHSRSFSLVYPNLDVAGTVSWKGCWRIHYTTLDGHSPYGAA
jgi:hypothetical protein